MRDAFAYADGAIESVKTVSQPANTAASAATNENGASDLHPGPSEMRAVTSATTASTDAMTMLTVDGSVTVRV